MRIGFLNNQIEERGSTWMAYLYAKHAREILGHSTVMLYPSTRYEFHTENSWQSRLACKFKALFSPEQKSRMKVQYEQRMADKIRRNGIEVIQTRLDANFSRFDAIHHFKYGHDDGFRPKGTRYWVHAVFDVTQPHGDRYAAVSRWLGREHGLPFVPHVVDRPDDIKNKRQELGIPTDGVVFGRYGARDTFDIPWVWDAIADALEKSKNVYFVFANTDVKMRHERIFDLPTMFDAAVPLEIQKRRFVNTCDVMLHARARGETFGIAVGEFAVCGKPVVAYAKSPERSHIEMLSQPILYNDAEELKKVIERIVSGEKPSEDGGAYLDCTPEKVMQAFDQVFIKCAG
jgi:hypothetical protein